MSSSPRKNAARKLRDKLFVEPTKKIELINVVRLLKTVRGINGKAWLVGGVLTEGYSRRDIDIVITDKQDGPIIKKALGSLGHMAHFIVERGKPPSPIILEITGQGPKGIE